MQFAFTTARHIALAAVLAGTAGLTMQSAVAKDKLVMAIPTFLTGGGAPAFGVPAKQGAEMMIEAINAGSLPAPYNTKGMAGAMIEPVIYDESGGNTKQVAEYRNKVQKENVDLFVGFVSSGTCQAMTPVAEELKVLTIFAVCGTPRVFEELDTKPKYVFRTMGHAAVDGIALARYVKAKFPDANGYTGINQNYAWGQDSYRDYDLAMKAILPNVKPSDSPQWPKLFAGQYGTEISALLLAKEDLVHSSLWGGDLEAFIFQSAPRALFKKKKVMLTVAGTAVYRLNDKMPDGTILGARGPYGIFAENIDTPLNKWFIAEYKKRYNTGPTGPSYQYAQAVLAAKIGYDKAAKAAGKFPTTDQVIDAMQGMEFDSMSTKVKFALGNGHQAITEHMYGITKYDKAKGEVGLTDVVKFPAECVNPPADTNASEWIKAGMPGAKC